MTRFTTGFSGSWGSKKEKRWARAQREQNFAVPRFYHPQPFIRGPRRYQSPPGWRFPRIRPPRFRWGGRYRNGPGEYTMARRRENILGQEQEERERQLQHMRRSPGLERGTWLARPPRRRRAWYQPHLFHGGRRAIPPARGLRPRPGLLVHPHLARRARPPPYDAYEARGRRGSMAPSADSDFTGGSSSYSDFPSDEDFSDAGSYTRVRSRVSPPRRRYSPVPVRGHGGRHGSVESDFSGAGSYGGGRYGGVPGRRANHPYNGGRYYRSDESFSVFPSTSHESW